MTRDEHWMGVAISIAETAGVTPFGCVIVDSAADREVARGANVAGADPTAHAEIAALRASADTPGIPSETALTLYTTAEPCPMCAAACFWARIDRIVFGVSIPWLVENGWRQIPVRAADLLSTAPGPPEVDGAVLLAACERLFLA